MMLNFYILGGFMLIINKSKPFYLNKMQKNYEWEILLLLVKNYIMTVKIYF